MTKASIVLEVERLANPHLPARHRGLLVVQDGRNFPPIMGDNDGEIENVNTNFKLVRWDALAAVFPGGLSVDPKSFDPRKPRQRPGVEADDAKDKEDGASGDAAPAQDVRFPFSR